jgi:hypothetical protein
MILSKGRECSLDNLPSRSAAQMTEKGSMVIVICLHPFAMFKTAGPLFQAFDKPLSHSDYTTVKNA